MGFVTFVLVYLCAFEDNSNPLSSSQTRVIPLYLGADLFSNTDIRTGNHPRHHAKFAKKGLATKVNFSSGDMFDGV